MTKTKETIDPRLKPCFAQLSKPAQRALIHNGIFTEADLARHSRAEIEKMHGIGPSAFPTLETALANAGLKF
ncbi:MAG: hypothetical protein WCC27_05810 [Acidobacteriaceae bacterium]